MFEKDLMEQMSKELSGLSDEERESRRSSLQLLLEAELKRRQQGGKLVAAKAKSGFWRWLGKLFTG